MKLHAWLGAFRLRTLPLALSTILLGSLLAASDGVFNFKSFYWAVLTTLLLQILSNLANDLGDSLKGTDNSDRIGPVRAVQSGEISIPSMKKAVLLFALLSFFSGLRLLYVSFDAFSITWVFFLVLGCAAIAAAIKYTLGKSAYAYHGLGDVFVFLFFGIVGVFGTYFLHSLQMNWEVLLPAASIGLFSAAVLNMNNMRDIENDAVNNKRTLVVQLGFQKAKLYHAFLIIGAMCMSLCYLWLHWSGVMMLIALISFPIFLVNLKFVLSNQEPIRLNAELKKLALGTLLFSLSFGFSMLLF